MKPYKAMTASNIAQINALYHAGLTCKEIAEITGYGRTTVNKYVLQPRRKGRRTAE